MKRLTYSLGGDIHTIIEDGKDVILIDVDKELGMAFVAHMDGDIDIIKSKILELEQLPIVFNLSNDTTKEEG